MFNQLIESKPKKQRSVGGTIFSIVFHTVLVVVLVRITQKSLDAGEDDKEQKVEFVEVKPDEPKPEPEPEKPPPPPDVTVAPPPPKGFQVLTAPIDIPEVLPDIDLSKKVTDEADFTGKGVAGGIGKGVVGGVGPVLQDQPYFEFQVEKPAMQAPGGRTPIYPDMLRSSNVEGEVLAQFVVDTSGRVQSGTFKVLKSSHDLFTAAVKNALPSMRFYPAEVGGKKVRQLVQQPFAFTLAKT